jgi:hypothetical protein
MEERKDRNLQPTARKAVETAIREDASSRLGIRAHVMSDPERKTWYADPMITGIHVKMKAIVNKGWVNPLTQVACAITEAAQYCQYRANLTELAAMRRFWNQPTARIIQELRHFKPDAVARPEVTDDDPQP